MSHLLITSPSNPKLKWLNQLYKSNTRKREGLMLVEGEKEISMALTKEILPTHLFYRLSFPSEKERQLIAAAEEKGAQVFELGEKAFQKVAYRDSQEGMIMVVKAPSFLLEGWLPEPDSIYLVIEGVEKPGNVGAMLRTADAVGCTGVILCDTGTDLTNPNVVRASLGTIFSVKVAQVTSEDALRWLMKNQIVVAAATPSGNITYTKAPLAKGPVAVVVGNEHHGLSPLWLDNAQLKVKIPMRGAVDSLNVATSAALMLYEVLRQKSFCN
jgi:TrmH family RNA methyltransferase